MRWMVFALGSALALAGCSSGESGSNASEKGDAPVTGGGQDQPTPSNLTDDPQNAIEPITLPSPRPVASFPPGFRGRWGMVAGDCDPARDDAKGLMEVTATGLRFHGSRGTVQSLAVVAPDTLTAQLSFTGEGRRWSRADRLTLIDGGKTLVRQEQKAPSVFRYSRCPA